MAYQLPNLPYDYNALEPHIDARTMEIHHDRHHAGYVNNLNTALEGHEDLLQKSVEDLLQEIDQVPEDVKQAVTNNRRRPRQSFSILESYGLQRRG